MNPLTPKRRSELRAEAHKLSPTVIIGDKGLTDEVIAEVDRSLKAHELIKVRAAAGERDARDVWLEKICERLEAHPVQQIGKVFVIYRENPKEERKKSRAAPSPAKAGARGDERKQRGRNDEARGDSNKRRTRVAETVKGTSRQRSRTPSPRPASEPRRRRPRTSR